MSRNYRVAWHIELCLEACIEHAQKVWHLFRDDDF